MPGFMLDQRLHRVMETPWLRRLAPSIKVVAVALVVAALLKRLGVFARIAFVVRVANRFRRMSTVPSHLRKAQSALAKLPTKKLNVSSLLGKQRVVSIGILGTASIAKYAVILPCRRYAGACVSAVASRSPERAQKFARRHGIPRVFASYQALLDSPNVVAVYISLPTNLHGKWARRAFAAGKHVLVEKPLCQNFAEGKLLVDIVKDHHLCLRSEERGGGAPTPRLHAPVLTREPSQPTIFETAGDEDDEGTGGTDGDEMDDDEVDFGGQTWVVEVDEEGFADPGENSGDGEQYPFLEDQEAAVLAPAPDTSGTALSQIPIVLRNLGTSTLPHAVPLPESPPLPRPRPVDDLDFTPVVMEAMHYRYHPLMKRVCQLVRSKALGHVVRIRANFSIFKVGALISKWKKTLGLRGKQNSAKLSEEARKAAEHARMKMLDRWCYCVDVARVILPGHEFSVMEVPRLDEEGMRVVLEAARWTDKADDVGPVTVELSSYCSSLSHAPFSWELTIEGTAGRMDVHNWGYPWLWNSIDVVKYSHTGSAEEKWSEELYASNGGTTFDGQLRAFVRRCHAAEDPQTRSPSPSSSTGSLDRQSDDERDDYDQHAQRRRDGDDAETWWQRNAAGGLAGAVRTAANGGDTEKHSSNQLTTAESESALDDTADFEYLDDHEFRYGVNELKALEFAGLDSLALVESVLLHAGQQPISFK